MMQIVSVGIRVGEHLRIVGNFDLLGKQGVDGFNAIRLSKPGSGIATLHQNVFCLFGLLRY